MSIVKLSLAEQSSDFRSSELPLRFTLANSGNTPLRLIYVQPRVPDGVIISEAHDKSLVDVQAKHRATCDLLSRTVSDYLILSSDEFFRKRVAAMNEFRVKAIKEISSIPGYFRVVSAVMFKNYDLEILKAAHARLSSLRVPIENASEAIMALDTYVPKEDTQIHFRSWFATHIARLQRLEEQFDPKVEQSYVGRVEAGSEWSATYVVQFPRRPADPSQYNINVEVGYQLVDHEETHVQSVSTVVSISPSPFVLNCVALAGAVLGSVLKMSMAAAASTSGASPQRNSQIGLNTALANEINPAFMFSSIGAAILAVVFFNIYEFTDLGKRINMRLGWRSALFIGAACGLFSDRIIKAFGVLVGQ